MLKTLSAAALAIGLLAAPANAQNCGPLAFVLKNLDLGGYIPILAAQTAPDHEKVSRLLHVFLAPETGIVEIFTVNPTTGIACQVINGNMAVLSGDLKIIEPEPEAPEGTDLPANPEIPLPAGPKQEV